jgi:hypothetical protein
MTDLIRSYVTWPNAVAYLFAGWLVYGLLVYFRAVKPGAERAVLIACLSVWWLALVAEVLGRLWKLLGWLANLAGVVFHPEHGPIALTVFGVRATVQRWAGRFRWTDAR